MDAPTGQAAFEGESLR